MQNINTWGVWNLWGLLCAAVGILLRPFRRVEAPIVPISPPIAPRQEERKRINIYPSIRGFSKPQKKKAQERIDEFHKAIEKDMWLIEDSNQHYGAHIEETLVGKGIFNGGNKVPKGVSLFVYFAALVEEGQQKRDKNAAYLFWYGPFLGFNCFLDARFTVTGLNPLNGGFLNHKCVDPNCEGQWVFKGGEWYLKFNTVREVKAGEQFTISYNPNNPNIQPTDPYLVPLHTLSHLPEDQVVKCLCEHPDECPKKMGFDRETIYGKPRGQRHPYGQLVRVKGSEWDG